MSANADCVVRAITDDNSFRVITASTTETVRGVIEAQKAKGITARHLGDLVTGTILIRETMSPQLRVQGIIRGAKGGNLVADSHPDGSTRGLANIAAGQLEVELGEGAVMQMMRTLANGAIHQGVIQVHAKGGISAALMGYMAQSEQVNSMIAVSTILENNEVKAAAGYIVQLLPQQKDGTLMVMTERLADFENIDDVVRKGEAEPDKLMSELLYRMPYARLEERALRFGCNCSQVRVVAGLASLQRSEIESLVSEGKLLEINCDFCGKHYEVSPEQLRGLLDRS
jgi:molecular chaperone Hsp33